MTDCTKLTVVINVIIILIIVIWTGSYYIIGFCLPAFFPELLQTRSCEVHNGYLLGLLQQIFRTGLKSLLSPNQQHTRCHAVAGRTARCRYKFRHNGIVHAVTLAQHVFLV